MADTVKKTWLERNWWWLALSGVGLIVLIIFIVVPMFSGRGKFKDKMKEFIISRILTYPDDWFGGENKQLKAEKHASDWINNFGDKWYDNLSVGKSMDSGFGDWDAKGKEIFNTL